MSAPNKEAMLSLPLEKKWQIWTSRRGTEAADTALSNNPEDYTNRLTDLAMVNRIKIIAHRKNHHLNNKLTLSLSAPVSRQH